MKFCGVDSETRSAVDLMKEGGMRYAQHETTSALCWGYQRNNQTRIWLPHWVREIVEWDGHPPPYQDREDGEFYTAVHAVFDRRIWNIAGVNKDGFPKTRIDDWVCTAIRAQLNGLPGALEKCGKALKVNIQKDAIGKLLINLLSKPITIEQIKNAENLLKKPQDLDRFARAMGIPTDQLTRLADDTDSFLMDLAEHYIHQREKKALFCEHPQLYKHMIKYCLKDVQVETAILGGMRELLEHELEEYWACEECNENGIPLDIKNITKITKFADAEKLELNKAIERTSCGKIERPTQSQRVKKWLTQGYSQTENGWAKTGRVRISPKCLKVMMAKDKLSLDKGVREELLKMWAEDQSCMTKRARWILEICVDNLSSVAKFKKMLNKQYKGFFNDAYSFSGAQASTRAASRGGINFQNLYRKCAEDFDETLNQIAQTIQENEDTKLRRILPMCASLIRPSIRAVEGQTLQWGDWSSIETRVTPWLCNNAQSKRKIEMFKAQDLDRSLPDMYVQMSKEMGFIGDNARQMGKAGELGKNFRGGWRAVVNSGLIAGVRLTREMAEEVSNRWEKANPWSKPYSWAVKDAAWNAMRHPERMYPAGRLAYSYHPKSHNGLGVLFCHLPNSTAISYVSPRLERIPHFSDPNETQWELTAMKASFNPKAGDTEWPRIRLWPGLLIENATQGVSACVTRSAIRRLVRPDNDYGWPPFTLHLQTHDEILLMSEYNVLPILVQQMVLDDGYHSGLPLYADGEWGKRYSKYSEGTLLMADALKIEGKGEWQTLKAM